MAPFKLSLSLAKQSVSVLPRYRIVVLAYGKTVGGKNQGIRYLIGASVLYPFLSAFPPRCSHY